MDKNDKFYKLINLLLILVAFTPLFGGLGIIYAGWHMKKTRWIDEGIIYMIPFILLTLAIFNDTVLYLIIIAWILTSIRSLMIAKTFLKELEEKDKDNTNPIKNIQQYNKKEENQISKNDKIIKINTATKEEISGLPGLNMSVAEEIIKLRNNGQYIDSLDDLLKLGLTNYQILQVEGNVDFTRKEKEKSNKRVLDI